MEGCMLFISWGLAVLSAFGMVALVITLAAISTGGVTVEVGGRRCKWCDEPYFGPHRCAYRLLAWCETCERTRFIDKGRCPDGHDEITAIRRRGNVLLVRG